MLKQRVLTAIVLLPVLMAAIFLLPNTWWTVALIVPLLIAGHEWSRLAGFGRVNELLFLAALVTGFGLLWAVEHHAPSRQASLSSTSYQAVYMFSTVFWVLVAPCWLRLQFSARHPFAVAATGVLVLLPMWLALVQLQNDSMLLVSLMAVVWIADSAAYFTGRKLGRRKLAPAISPGKTWEGVGGAFVAVTVYALILHSVLLSSYGISTVIAVFLGMTFLSIVGDLFESWLKRNAGAKDSGIIFPGHGGMLDRIDGVTAALPFAALVFV